MLEWLVARTVALLGARYGLVVLAQEGALSPVVIHRGTTPLADATFSRTVCERALASASTVVLSGPEDAQGIGAILSLHESAPGLVAAIPLVDEGHVLGVLYVDGHRQLRLSLKDQVELMRQVGVVGARALVATRDRRQIVGESERWKWLASEVGDEPDLTRTCVSPAMKRMLRVAERVAAEDVNVLVLGESGTGKEVICRHIHRTSPRRGGPFVALNCGAIPHDLMEAELFGHEAGAFTGPQARRPGRLELAQGGTLLLDEIGEMPRNLQVKLLRVLEQSSFERLGGNRPRIA